MAKAVRYKTQKLCIVVFSTTWRKPLCGEREIKAKYTEQHRSKSWTENKSRWSVEAQPHYCPQVLLEPIISL